MWISNGGSSNVERVCSIPELEAAAAIVAAAGAVEGRNREPLVLLPVRPGWVVCAEVEAEACAEVEVEVEGELEVEVEMEKAVERG
jgi:hypothetical protein